MNLNPFLTEVFNAYMASYKPLDERVRIEAELTALRAKLAVLEEQLAQNSVTGDDIQKFLINAEELLGGHASETVLTNMLVARFGGAQPQPKQRGARRKKSDAPAAEQGAEAGAASEQAAQPAAPPTAEVTKEEKALLLAVMTREPMSVTEVAAATTQHTGDDWLPSDVSPILKAMIKEGTVLTEGEKRGKRYMLAATSA